MSAQPEALRMADSLEDSLYSADGTSLSHYCQGIADEAAAELRRLHESNTELLAALKEAHACILGDHWGNALDVLAYAINKAERTTT